MPTIWTAPLRPQPAGSLPDLGADEFNQTTALTLTAEKLALPPVWVNRPDASSNPSGALLQQYWIRFHYGSADSQAASLDRQRAGYPARRVNLSG